MKNAIKAGIMTVLTLTVVGMAVGIGSVTVPLSDILRIFANRLWGSPLPADFPTVYPDLIMNLRLPRVCLAFLVGAAMAVSGTVMQSVLKNPLASPYGLGVSSGAGLGAALVMVGGISSGLLGTLMLPVAGLSFGLGTVLLVITVSSRMDRELSNHTIILIGMVISLFFNAMINTLANLSYADSRRILQWLSGTFSMKGWTYVMILFPVVLILVLLFFRWARELDVMTFGEEQAAALGVDLKKTKWMLLCMVALLTGTAVSFAGVIGFVDMVAPHIVRRFFGSSHRWVIPMSALFGGAFMVGCDLAARTLISPSEIPVGSVTALIGAPFFIYIYFVNRKKAASC